MRASHVCAAVYAALFGAMLPPQGLAQSQNPLDALKDALGKAKQQIQQQLQQAQPTQAQSSAPLQSALASTTAATQSASHSAPTSDAAPWSPPTDTAGAVAGAAVAVDPLKLPDIVGVRLGLTPEQTVAALHKEYPADIYERLPAGSWPAADKPVVGYYVLSAEPNNPQDVDLRFTAPPGQQMLYAIKRTTRHMHINHLTLLNALREKYGRESVAYHQIGTGDAPETRDALISDLIWVYDEQGKQLPPPPGTSFPQSNLGVRACFVVTPQMPTTDDFAKTVPDPCSHYVLLRISFDPFDIVDNLEAYMTDLPLGMRTAHAAGAWLHGVAQRQHKQAVEQSKSVRPSL